jgi:CheY-like chemotaxis protein
LIWLVAEDEADIRLLVATMIQVWGHKPVTFENGQKVWDWLDSVERGEHDDSIPEFVLMDIRMPGKKGNEVAQRMRTVPQLAHTPIVLMTAYALNDAERREMMSEGGVDIIIGKPLPDFEQLRQTLHNLIDQKRIDHEPRT